MSSDEIKCPVCGSTDIEVSENGYGYKCRAAGCEFPDLVAGYLPMEVWDKLQQASDGE